MTNTMVDFHKTCRVAFSQAVFLSKAGTFTPQFTLQDPFKRIIKATGYIFPSAVGPVNHH